MLPAQVVPEWSKLLRSTREARGLSRAAASKAAGASTATIRAYETGARRPNRLRLIALLDALQADPTIRVQVLEEAGYSREPPLVGSNTPGFSYTVFEAMVHIENQPWPVVVMNDNIELVAANRLARMLWKADPGDFAHPFAGNMLVVASNPKFADRILNWDEAVCACVAMLKSHLRGIGLEDGQKGSYFAAVLKALLRGRPPLRCQVPGSMGSYGASRPESPLVIPRRLGRG